MEYKDYYSTLGVAKGADEKEIKKAYRQLAREFHPDVNKDNPRRRGPLQGDQRGLRRPLRCGQAGQI